MQYYIGTQQELEKKSADIIASSIMKINKDKVILAIPGGRSVAGIFNQLKNKNIDWHKVHIFMVDERLVPIDDDESNFNQAEKIFLDYLLKQNKLPSENLHPFIMDNAKSDYGISTYEKELRFLGGNYDIVLLSSGEDGHCAALFPDHHSIKDESEYFLYMNDSPKPPAKRMTLSKKLLLRAQVAVLLFWGDSKKQALKDFNSNLVSADDCPCKYIKEIRHSHVFTNIK